VTYVNPLTNEVIGQEVYDTILLAIGRQADTTKLNLEAVKVEHLKNRKIICKDDDSTTVPNIFAIGDCV